MSTTTEDRTETLAEHREALEAARAAIFDSPTVDEGFLGVQWSFAALEALAEVSLELWHMAAPTDLPNVEVGERELPYRRVQALAPMKKKVAMAVDVHAERLEETRAALKTQVCDLEEAVGGLARALTGYGEEVPFAVLQALKELDVDADTEEVDQ